MAEAFALPGVIHSIAPLGNGNVNDTFLVEAGDQRYVLQRLNTQVFRQPELVMRNLQVLDRHVQQRLKLGELPAAPVQAGRRWVLPQVVCTRDGAQAWHCCQHGGFWRTLTFVDDARSVEVIEHHQQAAELGWGLGLFHHLISDLPVDQLADTLEGFHITPRYLEAYHRELVRSQQPSSPLTAECMAFIRDREAFAGILEQAKARGELPLRPIHGDPKINNMLLDSGSGEAIALIDLDTVKPGLVHYDIGDCLRSCCNPLGEETTAFDAVHFDLDLAGAILEGYLGVAGGFLTPTELRYIPDAAKLISFELGLRFFSDYLAGSTYFKADHPEHNLHRAVVQFRLSASIEAQETALRALVDQLQLGSDTSKAAEPLTSAA
ncbi:MAG: phosphotransferase enzyme family protein [Vulcanococcus sp.]